MWVATLCFKRVANLWFGAQAPVYDTRRVEQIKSLNGSLSVNPMLVHSFPPIETPTARVLILGSMPGVASLRRGEYYAHPQNAFWKIMAETCGFDVKLDYAQKRAQLEHRGIAVWDVLKSCVREGSLDSSIAPESEQANDLIGFLQAHAHVRTVFFNGAKADTAYRRHVAPRAQQRFPSLTAIRLPSTSPAHAGMTYAAKRDAWRCVVRELGIHAVRRAAS